MEKSKGPVVALNDQERFPLLTDLSYLSKLKQDEFAPRFNFQSGDRLTTHHLEKVNTYADNIRMKRKFWSEKESPVWLSDFVSDCIDKILVLHKQIKKME